MQKGEELNQYIHGLRKYAFALTRSWSEADDLVQEALRRVLEHIRRNHSIDNLKSYLFKALRNVRIDQLKMTQTRGVEVSMEDAVGMLSTSAQQDTRLQCRDLERGMLTLSEDQRQAIFLICMEGLSYEEVADIAEVPVGTVRSRLHRGREVLRDYMNSGPDGSQVIAPASESTQGFSEVGNE